MSNSPNLLGELSRATANRAAAAQAMLAAIRTADGRHLTGTLWRGDLLVTSEQALPKADEYQVVMPDGSTVTAQPAGRDNGTNVALLRLPQVVEATSPVIGQASPGHLRLRLARMGQAALPCAWASSTSSAPNGTAAEVAASTSASSWICVSREPKRAGRSLMWLADFLVFQRSGRTVRCWSSRPRRSTA
jgi:hypothetical protein